MYSIILAAIIELFKGLWPLLARKLNEPKTATDSPDVPKPIRDAWMRRRPEGRSSSGVHGPDPSRI